MFTGFTKETSDFLWELRFNNERPWFLAHKEQFERCLNRPLRELAGDSFGLLRRRWPERDFRLHVSRIYRDARRLFGRGPYKDHLWFSIKSGEIADGGNMEGPMFWFEVGAADFSWGMGFYGATTAQMAAFRRLIDANPARFERLAADIEKSGRFQVEGEEYKRPKGDRGALINKWYNRRRAGLCRSEDFGGVLLTQALPGLLAEDFSALMPMYDFFLEFYRAAENGAGDGRRSNA